MIPLPPFRHPFYRHNISAKIVENQHFQNKSLLISNGNFTFGGLPMKDIYQIAEMVKSGLDKGVHLPVAGSFDSKSILSLVSRNSQIQKIFQELFVKTTNEKLLEEYINWNINVDGITVSISPIEDQNKLKLQKKYRWVLHCTFETESKIYNLFLPIPSKDNTESSMLGIIPMVEYGRLLEWMEYYIVIEDKTTGKRNTKKLSITESRNELSLMDRIYSFWLEDALILALIQFSRKVLVHHSRFDQVTMDLLYSWCRIQVDTAYQKEYQRNMDIEVFPKWQEFFDFSQWARKNGYQPGLFISRISYQESYKPNNIQWVHMSEEYLLSDRYYPEYQYTSFRCRRALASHFVTINGITKSIIEWENESNVPFHIIESRINMGWKDDAVLATVKKRPNEILHSIVKIKGESKTIKEWAKISGISEKTLISRIRYGWANDDLLRPPTPRTK